MHEASLRKFFNDKVDEVIRVDTQNETEFHLTFTDEVSQTPLNGHLMVILSKDTKVDPDIPNPFQPFITFGLDFRNWIPGETLVVNKQNAVCFMAELDELQGDYSLRAIVDLDTTSSQYLIDGICYSKMLVISVYPGTRNRVVVPVTEVLKGFGFKESEHKIIKLEK